MFILLGHIPYDGGFVIGVFTSEELAIEGRKEYRQHCQDMGKVEPFNSYSIYAMPLDRIEPEIFNRVPVDVFQPGKQKVHWT